MAKVRDLHHSVEQEMEVVSSLEEVCCSEEDGRTVQLVEEGN